MNVARLLAALFVLLAVAPDAFGEQAPTLNVRKVDGAAPDGFVEVRGVAAGGFDSKIWRANTLHLLPDVRHPLIAPREGRFRNIYAPSIVRLADGWRVYYGAWDGVATGNDRIYAVDTLDFLTFGERKTVIEHGQMHHVCNVNVQQLPDGTFAMMCTALPTEPGLNKPVFFTSDDGLRWNGATDEAYAARRSDIITMEGYEKFDAADINGMNVLLHDGGAFTMYFSNFRDFGKTWRARSADGRHYIFERAVLEAPLVVNDVKKLIVGEQAWYLMGLHMNNDRLTYALSTDPLRFTDPKTLCRNLGDVDRYIVAIGWVIEGEAESPDRRVLGFLYGAGAKASLDANRIFARWLQKKIVFVTDDGRRLEPTAAHGPDRQLLKVGPQANLRGRWQRYAEDGQTLEAASEPVEIVPNSVYQAG